MSIFGDTKIPPGRDLVVETEAEPSSGSAADDGQVTAAAEEPVSFEDSGDLQFDSRERFDSSGGVDSGEGVDSTESHAPAETNAPQWVALESPGTVDSKPTTWEPSGAPATVDDPTRLLEAAATEDAAPEPPIDIVDPVADGTWVDTGASWQGAVATELGEDQHESPVEPESQPVVHEPSWTADLQATPAPEPPSAPEPDASSSIGDADVEPVVQPTVRPAVLAASPVTSPLEVDGSAADAETFSTLLRDMFADLSSSHDELVPDVQPVIDERDSVLGAVDHAIDPATLDGILFSDERQFPQHIVWLRHAGREISRLRRAELESDDALSRLSRLRETHLRRAVGTWSSGLPASGATAASDVSSSGSARFGTLKLAAVAADRGPAPLDRMLRRFRGGLRLRHALRWLGRLVWLGGLGALLVAWNRDVLVYAEYAAGAAAGLWTIQELLVNPRLDARHLVRLRTRVRGAVEDFYSARLIALIEMGLIRSQLGRMDSPLDEDSRRA